MAKATASGQLLAQPSVFVSVGVTVKKLTITFSTLSLDCRNTSQPRVYYTR